MHLLINNETRITTVATSGLSGPLMSIYSVLDTVVGGDKNPLNPSEFFRINVSFKIISDKTLSVIQVFCQVL